MLNKKQSTQYAHHTFPSGISFYRLTADGLSSDEKDGKTAQGFTNIKKMLLLK